MLTLRISPAGQPGQALRTPDGRVVKEELLLDVEDIIINRDGAIMRGPSVPLVPGRSGSFDGHVGLIAFRPEEGQASPERNP